MRGLYPIIDTDACAVRGLQPLDVAAGILRSRPPILQLRDKGHGAKEQLLLLRALRAMTPPSTLLFANDRPDLAVLAQCDGVHLGQSDLTLAQVREFAPGLKLGLSTHDLPQLENALAQGPDYVAFGPVFPTSSKRAAEPVVGLELLAEAHAACVQARLPLVAIGGVSLREVSSVATQAEMIAVIGALLPELATAESLTAASTADHVFGLAQAFARKIVHATF